MLISRGVPSRQTRVGWGKRATFWRNASIALHGSRAKIEQAKIAIRDNIAQT